MVSTPSDALPRSAEGPRGAPPLPQIASLRLAMTERAGYGE